MTLLKKIGLIAIAIVAIIGIIIGILLVYRKGKNSPVAINEVLEHTRQQMDAVEINAQIQRAEAAHVEERVVIELQEIKEIPDSRERRKRLAAML